MPKRALVGGMIATYPVGGVLWDYGHYLLGLEQLGYEVWYLEDTGSPVYDPVAGTYGSDVSYGIQFLQDYLPQLSPSLAGRWALRDASGTLHGMSEEQLQQATDRAELLLNVSGGTLLRDEYMKIPCKVLVDTDPGWNHFVNYPQWDAKPGWQGTHGYRAHDFHFTYAERLGKADCPLPDLGLHWLPTRPAVALHRWQTSGSGKAWTTVMTWNNFHQPVEFEGQVYGTKEMEFDKITEIPASRGSVRFEIAVGGTAPPVHHWQQQGWRVVDAPTISRTPESYRQYVQTSRGELSVAKNLYVATRSGWFSTRSACYLAAGRPVVVQDTGCSEFLPTGEGLCMFETTDQALAHLDCIETDYPQHQQAARDLAAEYFAAPRVLAQMLQPTGLL